jgi:hypothetical protein
MTSFARTSLASLSILAALAACEFSRQLGDDATSTGASSTTEMTADTSSSSSSSSGLAESSSGTEASTSTRGTTTGPPTDDCPPGVDGLQSSGTRLQILTDATDFPEYPPPHGVTYAHCSPLEFGRALRLQCTIPDWELQDHEFDVGSGDTEVQAYLASLLDQPTIALEVFAGSGFFPGWDVYQFTLRTSDGELLLFHYDFSLAVDIRVAIDPLGAIDAFDADCGARPAVHGHATVEQPWPLDFATDDGPVRLFDREAATVVVAETSYRIVVAGAYVELEGCKEFMKDFCRESAEFTVFRLDP